MDRTRATCVMATACALAALAGAAQAAGGTAGETPAGRTLGLAVTEYPFALYKGKDDCPDGYAKAAKELLLDSVSPAERVRLQKLENLKEFERRAYYTKDGKDVCQVPDLPRPPQRTPQGKVAFGLDLDGNSDGTATATTCQHENFNGPNGEAGIDNQHYRITGCSSNYIGHPGEIGYLESLRNSGLRDGGTTILIELKGVDDERNDGEVQVGVYNGADPMAIDPTGQVMLPFASLSVTDDAKYRAAGKGAIKDGVLLTEPMDIRIRYDFGGAKREYNVRAARLKLELKGKDGAQGLLAGYLSVDDVDMTKGTKQESAEMVAYDCPTWSQAIRRYADGFPDASGKCTAISTAWEIKAIPAFIIHPDKPQSTAQAAPAVQTR